MNDEQKYEMIKTFVAITSGLAAVMLVLNLILDIFGRVYL